MLVAQKKGVDTEVIYLQSEKYNEDFWGKSEKH